MSDQPVTLAVLAQFYREVMLPDFERVIEKAASAIEPSERWERLSLRSALWWLNYHESMYGFLRDDIRRLERRLDEIHVRIDRSDSGRMAETLQLARDYYGDALATWTRLKGYLPEGEDSITKVADGPTKDSLHAEAVTLRSRVEGLAPALETAGRRLNLYTKRGA